MSDIIKTIRAEIERLKIHYEQGVTAEGEIVKDISNKLAVTAKTPLLENRFNFGEKVLIQIRKK